MNWNERQELRATLNQENDEDVIGITLALPALAGAAVVGTWIVDVRQESRNTDRLANGQPVIEQSSMPFIPDDVAYGGAVTAFILGPIAIGATVSAIRKVVMG